MENGITRLNPERYAMIVSELYLLQKPPENLPYLTSVTKKAMQIAHSLHKDDYSPGEGIPRIHRLVRVGRDVSRHQNLTKALNREWLVAAAYLQDSIRSFDKNETGQEALTRIFNNQISGIIMEITEDNSLKTLGKRKENWLERKTLYLSILNEASIYGQIIAASYQKDHLNAMIVRYKKEGNSIWAKYNAPADKQIWFIEEVLKVLKKHEGRNEFLKILTDELGQSFQRATVRFGIREKNFVLA